MMGPRQSAAAVAAVAAVAEGGNGAGSPIVSSESLSWNSTWERTSFVAVRVVWPCCFPSFTWVGQVRGAEQPYLAGYLCN